MSAARTERLLNLLTLLLNARRPVSLRELRDLPEFDAYAGVDLKSGERAFERDKAALIEAGVPLRWVAPEHDEDDEGQGGYVVDRERYYLPELVLSPADWAQLSIAGAAALSMQGFPGRAALSRALAKLGFDVDAEAPKARYLSHAPLMGAEDRAGLALHLEHLHDAVGRRVRLRLDYASAKGDETRRDVDPYGLYYRQGAWYLVGHCHLRQAERTFHLGRVNKLVLVGRGGDFEVPPTFDLKQHVDRRPWELPGEAPFEVSIRLAERLLPAAAELFGKRARLTPSPDGGATVILTVTNRSALVAAVLPHGAAACVLAPADLRAELRQAYRALVDRYARPGAV